MSQQEQHARPSIEKNQIPPHSLNAPNEGKLSNASNPEYRTENIWFASRMVRDAYSMDNKIEKAGSSSIRLDAKTPFINATNSNAFYQKLQEFQSIQAKRAMETLFYGTPLSIPSKDKKPNGSIPLE